MGLERLEQRSLLAGNVNVSVDGGGNLFVRGDNNDNGVLISQIGRGRYAVTGYDLGSGATRINGSANGTRTVSGVTGDIVIDLKQGNDALGVGNSAADLEALAEGCGFGLGLATGSGSGDGGGSSSESSSENTQFAEAEPISAQQVESRLFAPRSLIINTRDGDDAVAVIANVRRSAVIDTGNGADGVAIGNLGDAGGDINVGADLVVLTGKGNDDTCVSFATVRGLLNVQTGDGSDVVSAEEFDAGAALVITGKNSDAVTLSRFDTDRTVVVDTGKGHDIASLTDFSAGQGFGPHGQRGAGHVTVLTGSGDDAVQVAGNAELETTAEMTSLTVNSGSGNDQVTLDDLIVRKDLFAILGSGNDILSANNDQIGRNLLIDAGSGNDNVLVSNSQIHGNTTILMGAGNDTLVLVGTSGDRRLNAFGGSGRDRFSNDFGVDSNGSDGDVLVLEFESFGPPQT